MDAFSLWSICGWSKEGRNYEFTICLAHISRGTGRTAKRSEVSRPSGLAILAAPDILDRAQMNGEPHKSVERTGISRSARGQFQRHWRLLPVAHLRRSP